MGWSITYYDEALQEGVLSLPKDLQARYIRITERMVVDGPDIGMPHTRAMSKGLFEIRLKGKQIVMLHCFIKKTEKTPPRELAQGYRKMREVLDAQS